MLTKNAMGNLANRYKSVLKKCHLLNTFGTLALATFLAVPTIANAAINLENNNGLPIAKVDTNLTWNDALVGFYGKDKESVSLTNSSAIQFTNNENMPIFGILAEAGSELAGKWSITNNALIDINNVSSGNNAYGIASYGSGIHTLSNTSTVKVASASEAFGMYSRASYGEINSSSIKMLNSGTIDVKGRYSSYGMYAYVGSGGLEVESLAPLAAMKQPTTVINSDLELTNTNKIFVTSENGNAYGMYATSDLFRITSLETYAIPADIGNIVNSTITLNNSGTIDLVSTRPNEPVRYAGASLYGMRADWADAGHFNNTGTINITASGYTNAYGIYASEVKSGTINNLGIINFYVDAGNTYEVYVDNQSSLYVRDYALTLKQNEAGEEIKTFYVNNSSSLDFSRATLYLRPGKISSGEFAFGKEYTLDNFAGVDRNSSANIQQAALATEADFIVLSTSTNAAGEKLVSLRLDASELPTANAKAAEIGKALDTASSVSTSVRTALGKLYRQSIRRILASNSEEQSGMPAGSEMMMPESKWNVFFNPYLGYTNNSKYDFDGTSYGLTAGATHAFSDAFALGFHFDVNSLTSQSDDMHNDSKSFAFGLHANYFLNDAWYLSALASYAHTSNDMDYSVSSDTANAEYSSNAFFASLNTGYMFEINQDNIINVETGLTYLSANTDAYDLDFAHLSAYNMAVGSTNLNALYAHFNVNWEGTFTKGNNIFRPSVGLGLRQNLTGSDVDTTTEIFGTRYENVASSDDTTFTANAGVEWQRDALSISLNYNGEYGSDQQSHRGSLLFKYEF